MKTKSDAPSLPGAPSGLSQALAKLPPPARGTSEAELVQRLRAGDSGALETLMERYTSRVYRLAFGITQHPADAEEVVQDVFLTLFRKIHSFEGRSALGTWIYRVTVNAALIKRRSQQTDREVSLESLLPRFRPDGRREGDPASLRADWSQTPEEGLLSQETREILHQVITALPAPYRAVLLLRDVEGISTEEAASVVGTSVAAVKSRLHRARLAVRERLTAHLGPKVGARRRRVEYAVNELNPS
jgi:RNA polymerase sigma-70 factor (ECF subfamily)